jgi:hypothetical protein
MPLQVIALEAEARKLHIDPLRVTDSDVVAEITRAHVRPLSVLSVSTIFAESSRPPFCCFQGVALAAGHAVMTTSDVKAALVTVVKRRIQQKHRQLHSKEAHPVVRAEPESGCQCVGKDGGGECTVS